MEKFQRKQRIKHIIYSIPSLIILSIIAFFLAKGTVRIVNKEWESRESSKSLKEKTAALVVREQELKEGIARLGTEEGIKDEIRKRFSVTQEGELVAVIVDDRVISSTTGDVVSPWYKRLWIAIMGGK